MNKLQRKKVSDMSDEMIIGRNPVIEALKSGSEMNKILLSEHISKQTEREVQQLAKKANTIVQKAPKQRLDHTTKGRHRGIIAYVSSNTYSTGGDFLRRGEERNEAPCIMILDEL